MGVELERESSSQRIAHTGVPPTPRAGAAARAEGTAEVQATIPEVNLSCCDTKGLHRRECHTMQTTCDSVYLRL